ncbi:MAG: transporter permease [Bacteroidota bacterium]|nr:transporter permease [Bacteroidota bacterium]
MKKDATVLEENGEEAKKQASKFSIAYLSERLDDFFGQVDTFTRFTLRFFKEAFMPPYEVNEFLKQCYLVGNKSLPLVGLTALIMGLVFTMQSRPTLTKFGAQSWLPAMVAIAMIREISPVITALICAGKVGSGIGAELASMRVTEQIDAMEVSGNRPFKYLVVTRVMAITLMVPLLAIFSDSISLLGSFIGVNLQGDTTAKLFLSHIFEKLDFIDVFPAIIKTFFFGFAIGIISCYKGYNSNSGTEGVGRAANTSVVQASLTIFIIDMLAVQVANFFT